jgi:hypothetical protein
MAVGPTMNKLDKMAKQAESMGYKTEFATPPDWMKPYDKMLIIRLASGFIYQVVPYNSATDEFRIVK